MILVDANILIYAINSSARQHEPARRWLEGALSDGVELGFPWIVLLAFLRITTHRAILEKPLKVETALKLVDSWIRCPGVEVIHPGRQHWEILRSLLELSGAGGNLTTDAHLAALAIENAAKLCSADYDFRRFPGVQHFSPFEPAKDG